jgi:hypothetical protein
MIHFSHFSDRLYMQIMQFRSYIEPNISLESHVQQTFKFIKDLKMNTVLRC